MTQAEARRAKADFEAIRSILHADWDPFGGAPLDEYDAYCWPVLALLRRKAPRAELETYLCWAAETKLRAPVPPQRLSRVLDMLMAIQPAD